MTKIVILTNGYPYAPGETFLEEEIKVWAASSVGDVYILPNSRTGELNSYPKRIKLSNALLSAGWLEKFLYALSALKSKVFWREITYLMQAGKLNAENSITALLTTAHMQKARSKLATFIRTNGPIDIAYAYWNESTSYAACLLKREGLVKKVIARAHGYDLYEERRKGLYMPIKRQFVGDFDKIYCISDEGRAYYRNKYQARDEIVQTSRLGVSVDGWLSQASDDGNLRLVSLSFCHMNKRIDKIVWALKEIAKMMPDMPIKWTHIGDGPYLSELKALAARKLTGHDNVSYKFTGYVRNQNVQSFLAAEKIDLILNTSESEGVPVSLMEAMSKGIPAIAPNVGGVADLVDSDCGLLMSSAPTVQEIASAVLTLAESPDKLQIRRNAAHKVASKFNAAVNFARFVDEVIQLNE